jgi:hypothetical protein
MLKNTTHHISATLASFALARTQSSANLRAITIYGITAAAFTVFSANAAHATNDLNTYVQNVSGRTNSVVDIVTYFSYIGGAALSALGIIDLKKHVENPGNNPLKNGLAKLGFGGMLLAFPSISSIVVGTVSDGSGQVQYQQFGSRPTI